MSTVFRPVAVLASAVAGVVVANATMGYGISTGTGGMTTAASGSNVSTKNVAASNMWRTDARTVFAIPAATSATARRMVAFTTMESSIDVVDSVLIGYACSTLVLPV